MNPLDQCDSGGSFPGGRSGGHHGDVLSAGLGCRFAAS